MYRLIDLSSMREVDTRGIPLSLLMAVIASNTRNPTLDFPNLPKNLPDNFKAHAFSCRQCLSPDGFCLDGARMLIQALLGDDFAFDSIPVEVARQDEMPDPCAIYKVSWQGTDYVMMKDLKGNKLFSLIDSVDAERIMRELAENQQHYMDEMQRRYGPDAKPEQGDKREEAAKAVAPGA